MLDKCSKPLSMINVMFLAMIVYLLDVSKVMNLS